MFKIAKNILLTVALTTSLSAMDKLSNNEIKEIEKTNLFKRYSIKIKEAYDAKSAYILDATIEGKPANIYLTKDKKYLISGDVINLESGQALNIPVDMSLFKGKEAFTYGTGKDEYVLFTNPDCRYCKQFEENFPQIKDKVKFKIFYLPFQTESSQDKSLYIMSQKTQALKEKAMFSPKMIDRDRTSKKELEKLEKTLNEHIQIAINNGIQGTPTILDKNGNRVNWMKLVEDLSVK